MKRVIELNIHEIHNNRKKNYESTFSLYSSNYNNTLGNIMTIFLIVLAFVIDYSLGDSNREGKI